MKKLITILFLTALLVGLFDTFAPQWACFVQPQLMDVRVETTYLRRFYGEYGMCLVEIGDESANFTIQYCIPGGR